jgi:hypothetical protein
MEAALGKLLGLLLTAVLGCGVLAPSAALAQDTAQNAEQIARSRSHACRGTKGAERQECMQNYVGPTEQSGRDSLYANKRRNQAGGKLGTRGVPGSKPGRE